MLTVETIGPRRLNRLPEGVEAQPYDRFGVRPLSPTIGAEITGVDLSQPLAPDVLADVERAWLEWKVLFFRDQHLERSAQAAFARNFGDLEQHPFFSKVPKTLPDQPLDAPEVARLAKSDAAKGYENVWHHDVTWREFPARGAVLRAVEVPSVGGDTLWADMAAAYDNLPLRLRDPADRLDATHDWRSSFGLLMEPEEFAELDRIYPVVTHPVVVRHPRTGRSTLYVNGIFTTALVGLDADESDALLAELCAAANTPEIQCRWHWEAGDVAFWDNVATQHYATSDYFPAVRVMERVSIAGTDRPAR